MFLIIKCYYGFSPFNFQVAIVNQILSYFTQIDVPKSLMQVYPTHIQTDTNFKANFNLVFKVPLPL